MMTVKRITICSGVFVDSIQLTLSDGITDFLMDKHGGNGGGKKLYFHLNFSFIAIILWCNF